MMAPPHRQKLVLMSEINKGPADVDHQRPRSQDGACAVTQSFSLSKKPESKVGEWQSAHLNKRRVSCIKCASAVRIRKYPGYVIWSSVNYLNMRLSAAGDRTYVPPLPLWQLQLCTDGLQSSLQKQREHEKAATASSTHLLLNRAISWCRRWDQLSCAFLRLSSSTDCEARSMQLMQTCAVNRN